MWYEFFVAVLVSILFLYVPGFLLIRAFHVSRIVSLICAPFVSIVVFILLCMAYPKLGISSSWFTIILPILVLSVVAFACSRFVMKKKSIEFGFESMGKNSSEYYVRHSNALCLALYVGMGVVIASIFLLGNMETANSFSQDYDNVHHLGMTRAYLESGNWSPLASTLYATGEDAAINPLPGASFYPSAWSCLVALAVSALNIPITLGASVVNYVFIAIVFPSSMFFLMRILFKENQNIVIFGAFCILGFVAFPWGLLSFGPLYPNMIAYCFMPSVACCFITFLQGESKLVRLSSGLLFCIGILSFAFTQPNAVFTVGAFLAPFCVCEASSIAARMGGSRKKQIGIKFLFGVLAIIVILIIWCLLYKAPFMQSTVTHYWPSFESLNSSFINALLLSFRSSTYQVVLAILVVLGGIFSLFKRQYLWLTCSYALACALYMVGASTDGFFKFFLTGFWYTDTNRIAAFVCIFAIPLASMGLWLIARGLANVLNKIVGRNRREVTLAAAAAAAAAVVVLMTFLCLNYYSGKTAIAGASDGVTAFDAVGSSFKNIYSSSSPQVYDADEMVFVEEVQQIVPEGALIMNLPDDGSAFAFGVDGLRVYYRNLRTYGLDDEAEASRKIRNHLNSIEEDVTVQDAVKSIGAEYVLLLDQGESKNERRYLFTYEDGRNWGGLTSINDNTPGFEVVLARGDMRLYKIVSH